MAKEGLEKSKDVFGAVWQATVTSASTGLDFTREKSKQLGEKWDSSETGQKVNLGASVAGSKVKEVSSVAWDKTVEGFTAVKENDKVKEITGTIAETTSIWGKSLMGWFKGENAEPNLAPRTEVRDENPDLSTPSETPVEPPKTEILAEKVETAKPNEEQKD